jgi:hypothetical protein
MNPKFTNPKTNSERCTRSPTHSRTRHGRGFGAAAGAQQNGLVWESPAQAYEALTARLQGDGTDNALLQGGNTNPANPTDTVAADERDVGNARLQELLADSILKLGSDMYGSSIGAGASAGAGAGGDAAKVEAAVAALGVLASASASEPLNTRLFIKQARIAALHVPTPFMSLSLTFIAFQQLLYIYQKNERGSQRWTFVPLPSPRIAWLSILCWLATFHADLTSPSIARLACAPRQLRRSDTAFQHLQTAAAALARLEAHGTLVHY